MDLEKWLQISKLQWTHSTFQSVLLMCLCFFTCVSSFGRQLCSLLYHQCQLVPSFEGLLAASLPNPGDFFILALTDLLTLLPITWFSPLLTSLILHYSCCSLLLLFLFLTSSPALKTFLSALFLSKVSPWDRDFMLVASVITSVLMTPKFLCCTSSHYLFVFNRCAVARAFLDSLTSYVPKGIEIWSFFI